MSIETSEQRLEKMIIKYEITEPGDLHYFKLGFWSGETYQMEKQIDKLQSQMNEKSDH